MQRMHATLSAMNVLSQTRERIGKTYLNLAERPAQSAALIGLCGFILLLPFGRLSELGVLLCMVSSAICLAKGQIFRNKNTLALRAALTCWTAIFLAALISCLDSSNALDSQIATVGSVRFISLIIAAAQLNRLQRMFLSKLVGVTLGIWCLDAMLQAACGYSLGGHSNADRISGIFGDDNLKLGLVTAVLAPIALFVAHEFRSKWLSPKLRVVFLAMVWLIFATAILLAGARAGWVMFAIVSLLWSLRLSHYKLGRAAAGLAIAFGIAICLAAILNATNSRFAQRVERTMAIFDMQTADFALAGRVPIWQTALQMAAAHPVNGVGVRAFRYAYPDYAPPGDPWIHALPAKNMADAQKIGASHPHQLLLEILAETGLIGLTLWIFSAAILVRAWLRAKAEQRLYAWPYACALVALTFPINTHTALYS